MKKIGILTFHRASNYGAVLQAYALKTKIEELGCYAEIIDYRNDIIEQMYDSDKYLKLGGIKNIIRHIKYKRSIIKRNELFELFRREYLNITKNIVYTSNSIMEAVKNYDCIVVGSDQVWNTEAHGFDKNYFLEFVDDKSKKFSYAASFGKDQIANDHKDEIKRLLSDFAICSVREKQGEDILAGMGIIKTRVDVDPVMLLSKEDWKRNVGARPSFEKYVLIYTLSFTEKQKRVAEYLHSKGYNVKMIGKPRRNPFSFDCAFFKLTSPMQFLQLIENASFVITNSFHGTAFSILFNIPMAIELYERNFSNVNSRLINITDIFGLSNRIINNIEDYTVLSDDINWTYINSKIEKLRKVSVDYIKEVILNE